MLPDLSQQHEVVNVVLEQEAMIADAFATENEALNDADLRHLYRPSTSRGTSYL